MRRSNEDITELLQLGQKGDRMAQEQAIGLLYAQLRKVASHLLRREHEAHTITAGDLVQESLMRLFGNRQPEWESRRHLLAFAARSMRQILVSQARRRNASKRPPPDLRICLTDVEEVAAEVVDVEILDMLLKRLEEIDPRQVEIVELKFFAGMTVEEIARSMDLSVATIMRHWKMARAWLKREMESNAA